MNPHNLIIPQALADCLITPHQYAEFLHPASDRNAGRVALTHREPGGRWIERSVAVRDLPDRVTEWTTQYPDDCYLSMNRFKGRRLLFNLYSLRAVWTDLDKYERLARLRAKSQDSIWYLLQQELAGAQLPYPSIVIDSGRGFYVIWLFQPVPAQALPRWHAVQERIFTIFRPLGADPKARDAARVLRLPGTVNSKSGRMARVVGGNGYTWSFDALADEILPLTRAQIHDIRVQRALRQTDRKPTPRRHQSLQSLWSARLADLKALITLRWPSGQIPSGQRDAFIFTAAICMSWLSDDPTVLEKEIIRFARTHAPWTERETRSRVSAVLKRLEQFRRGETVEYQGRQVDPRYHLRTSTILDWLAITEQEQWTLKTLIGSDEKRRRKRLQERKHSDRETYLAQHPQERTKPWVALGMSRATWYRVGCPVSDTPEVYENSATPATGETE